MRARQKSNSGKLETWTTYFRRNGNEDEQIAFWAPRIRTDKFPQDKKAYREKEEEFAQEGISLYWLDVETNTELYQTFRTLEYPVAVRHAFTPAEHQAYWQVLKSKLWTAMQKQIYDRAVDAHFKDCRPYVLWVMELTQQNVPHMHTVQPRDQIDHAWGNLAYFKAWIKTVWLALVPDGDAQHNVKTLGIEDVNIRAGYDAAICYAIKYAIKGEAMRPMRRLLWRRWGLVGDWERYDKHHPAALVYEYQIAPGLIDIKFLDVRARRLLYARLYKEGGKEWCQPFIHPQITPYTPMKLRLLRQAWTGWARKWAGRLRQGQWEQMPQTISFTTEQLTTRVYQWRRTHRITWSLKGEPIGFPRLIDVAYGLDVNARQDSKPSTASLYS